MIIRIPSTIHRLARAIRRFDFRVFCWVFVGVLVLTTIWAHLEPRVYESAGVLQRLHTGPLVMVDDLKAAKMRTQLTEPIPTLDAIDLEAVVQRLTADDIAELLKQYGHGADAEAGLVTDLLRRNVAVVTLRSSFLFRMSYRHADPSVAFKVAEAFVDTWVADYTKVHASESVEYIAELKEMRDRRLEQLVRERDELASARVASQKVIELAVSEQREAANAYLEQLNNSMRRSEEAIRTINIIFSERSEEVQKLPLRVLDRPLLHHPDQYVRTPIMKILRWRWGIAAVAGLLAVGMMRRLGQATRSRSRLREGLTKV